MLGCDTASLDEVFRLSRIIFVVAGVTSENQGFLGSHQFSQMQSGAALVLVSRAAVVDFDAMVDFGRPGRIRVATDVFPQEPLPAAHTARQAGNVLLCAHQAGTMDATIHTKLCDLESSILALRDTHLTTSGPRLSKTIREAEALMPGVTSDVMNIRVTSGTKGLSKEQLQQQLDFDKKRCNQ